MHTKSYWMVALAATLALIMSACGSNIMADDYPSASEVKVLVTDRGGSAAATIRVVAGTHEPEPQKSEGSSGIRADSGSDQSPAKSDEPAKAPDEIQGLKERIIELQNKGKLGFKKIVLCRSVEGFGVYSPLEAGEPINKLVFYCEPSNVSTLLSGDRYIIDGTVGAVLMDSAGKTLLGKESIVKISRVSRSPVIDLFSKVEINFKTLPARKLFVKIVLHDKIKNQSVTATHRINVEAGANKPLDKI